MDNVSKKKGFDNQPEQKENALALLRERANEAADLYKAGKLSLTEAVDRAQDFATGRGIIDLVGPDLAQAVLAAAFRSARHD